MIQKYVEGVNNSLNISENPYLFLITGIIPLSSLSFWQDDKDPSTNGHNDLSKKTCARPTYRQKGIVSLTARTNITTCALQSEDYNSQKDRKTSQTRKRTK